MGSARKHRSFTSELLFWILLLVVAPMVLISIFLYRNTMDGLLRIEQEKAIQTNESAAKSIANLGATILGVTITNGYWEDNRQAVLSGDMEWLQTNISDMPSVVPDVDFVAEADLQGNVLVQSGNDKDFAGKVGFPVIMERFKEEKKFSGLLNTSQGAAVIAVSQVTGNQGEGETVGMLITGRLLTEEMLQEINAILQTDIALLLKSGQFLSSTEELAADSLGPYLDTAADGPDHQFTLERRNQVFWAQTAAPLLDMSGQTMGVIYTQALTVSTTETTDRLRDIGIYACAVMAFLLLLVIYLLRQRIVLPLRHFTATLEEVASGRAVEAMPRHVLQAEAEIVSAIQKIMQWNHTLEQTVQRRTAEIRNLLDNARQGFMSIGSDLMVRGEYSVECARIFTSLNEAEPSDHAGKSAEWAGQYLPALLYAGNPEEKQLLESILLEYFQEQEAYKKELIFSLLPDEVQIGELAVHIEFKELKEDDVLMVMLTDISEKRRLEHQMNKERRVLKMVVQIVTHSEDYAEIKQDFERFYQTELAELLSARLSADEKLLAIYKSIHTFKGSFALLHMIHIVPKLHELESRLQAMLQEAEAVTDADVSAWISSLRFDEWLAEDEHCLKQVLGDSFALAVQELTVTITQEQWLELEAQLDARLRTPEDREWLAGLKTWRYKPFQTLIKHYPDYIMELADRMGVLLHPVKLRGGDMLVDPEVYQEFTKSLIHVVRNLIVHGIESPDERSAMDKDELGTITFDVSLENGQLRVLIADDGQGIDVKRLRVKAREQGMTEAEILPDEEIKQMIFREQFSTSRQVNEWSGRGVGLSVVKEELDKLGGTIHLSSSRGAGTAFQFMLPYAAISEERR